jgi:urea-proton symporter
MIPYFQRLILSYGIVVGVGALFAVSMIFITRVLSKYLHEEQDSEMYSTANRSVKMGSRLFTASH